MSERSSSAGSASAFFDRLRSGPEPVFEQLDRNAKSLLQSALTRLDVVSREEFDAQTAVLKRTRERLEALEKQLAQLDESLQSQIDKAND
jgi:BMFP domain-containing protein YqiC